MGCCGCRKKVRPVNEDEKLRRQITYLNSLKRQQCSYCRGIMREYTSGVVVCTRCGRRKK